MKKQEQEPKTAEYFQKAAQDKECTDEDRRLFNSELAGILADLANKSQEQRLPDEPVPDLEDYPDPLKLTPKQEAEQYNKIRQTRRAKTST